MWPKMLPWVYCMSTPIEGLSKCYRLNFLPYTLPYNMYSQQGKSLLCYAIHCLFTVDSISLVCGHNTTQQTLI